MQLHDEVAKAKWLMKGWAKNGIRLNMERANQSMTHVANALTILSRCVVVGPHHRAQPDSRIASQLIEAQTYLQQFLLKPEDEGILARVDHALFTLTEMFKAMDVYEFPLGPKADNRTFLHPGGMVRGPLTVKVPGSGSRFVAESSRRSGKASAMEKMKMRGATLDKVIYDEVHDFIPDMDL